MVEYVCSSTQEKAHLWSLFEYAYTHFVFLYSIFNLFRVSYLYKQGLVTLGHTENLVANKGNMASQSYHIAIKNLSLLIQWHNVVRMGD